MSKYIDAVAAVADEIDDLRAERAALLAQRQTLTESRDEFRNATGALSKEVVRLREAIAHHHKHAREDGLGVRTEDARLYRIAGVG